MPMHFATHVFIFTVTALNVKTVEGTADTGIGTETEMEILSTIAQPQLIPTSIYAHPFPSLRSTRRSARFLHKASVASSSSSTTTTSPPSKLSKVVKWDLGKRLQTQTTQITPDITTIRSLDWDRDRFDM